MSKCASARWKNRKMLTGVIRLVIFLLTSQSGSGCLLVWFSVAKETLLIRIAHSYKVLCDQASSTKLRSC